MAGATEHEAIIREVVDELERRGVPDAMMLRRVERALEAQRDVTDLLEDLRKYLTAGAEARAQ